MKLLRNLILVSPISLALGVTITVDSFQSGNPASNAIDGSSSTFWHTQYTPSVASLPHVAYLDLGQATIINGFTYLPRQDSSSNGNIGKHSVQLSLNNSTWTLAANATFADSKSKKTTGFTSTSARYIRFTAFTEAGNRGQWSSAAELGVSIPLNSSNAGQWSSVINFPLVPAAAF